MTLSDIMAGVSVGKQWDLHNRHGIWDIPLKAKIGCFAGVLAEEQAFIDRTVNI